jgi:hypothetical protein
MPLPYRSNVLEIKSVQINHGREEKPCLGIRGKKKAKRAVIYQE